MRLLLRLKLRFGLGWIEVEVEKMRWHGGCCDCCC